jgi:thiamine-monophosphate kinase
LRALSSSQPHRKRHLRDGTHGVANEFALIAKYFAPLATSKAALGLRDDVAVLNHTEGRALVFKTDPTIEGVHFLEGDPPDLVARKALRRNLSDMAAKGAKPVGYLMSLALPKHAGPKWLAAFSKGLARDQRTFGFSLLGGDTASTRGPIIINITMIGEIVHGEMTPRAGARSGDLVFVSGTLGDASLGLSLLMAGKKEPRAAVARYRLPEPRLALGRALIGIARAAIDVSDGLIQDLGHIADTSGVRIEVSAGRIPLSRDFRRLCGTGEGAVIQATTAGDDYEIAFTCGSRDSAKVIAAAKRTRTRVTQIGTVKRGRGVAFFDTNGTPMKLRRGGYQHF